MLRWWEAEELCIWAVTDNYVFWRKACIEHTVLCREGGFRFRVYIETVMSFVIYYHIKDGTLSALDWCFLEDHSWDFDRQWTSRKL